MKWLLTVLLVISAAGSCEPLVAKTSDWSEKERKLWHSYLALSTIDTFQTFKMIDCQNHNPKCTLEEMNPILGSHPQKHQVVILKVAGNAVIYRLLDKRTEDREKALKWINGVQGLVVTHNGIYYNKRF